MNILLLLMIVFSGTLMEETKKNKNAEKMFNYHFQQYDYQLKFERVEMLRYNHDVFKSVFIHTFKYNRTCPAVNATLTPKVDLSNEFEFILQAYKFMSNEYRYFPLRFQANFCKALKADMFGVLGFTKCGNFTGCPLLKGTTYHVCNWFPDSSKFPPFIPNGQYMLEVQGLIGSTETGVLQVHVSVDRPIHWE